METNSHDPRADWVVPDYGGACLSNLLPALAYKVALERSGDRFPTAERIRLRTTRGSGVDPSKATWVPEEFAGCRQLVLLVLDGLGYNQLVTRLQYLPNLAGLNLSRIHSVAPTTTASALTSITTGRPPSSHGVVGYRMRVGPSEVINTLRWMTDRKESRWDLAPLKLAPVEPFFGLSPAVVTKAIFGNSGFSTAHLRGGRNFGWRTQSGIVSWIQELLKDGEPLVYVYYDGVDTTAHEFGLREKYERELEFLDYMIGAIVDALPPGVGLAITSDHGQVEVMKEPFQLPGEVLSNVNFQSGEGRFRWLHLRSKSLETVVDALGESLGEVARVMTRQEVVEQGIFGPDMGSDFQRRLGDVALIATQPVAFFDPLDTGPFELVCRHGALTADEVAVPLLSYVTQ